MSEISWQAKVGVFLVLLSALLYAGTYSIFHEAGNMEFWMLNNLAFLPLEVLLVTIILNNLLSVREKQERLEKLNMVIGIFFSEVGTKLLTYLSDYDPKLDTVKRDLIGRDWSDEEFKALTGKLKGYEYNLEAGKINMEQLSCFLLKKRDFMLRLSENPNLLEHESFTDLLRAVFHLTEELANRKDVTHLPPLDREHLSGDVKRIYGLIVLEWVSYMNHLRVNYPYMFSLAMRTNPFDQKASATICE
jgi:hypothetical protein